MDSKLELGWVFEGVEGFKRFKDSKVSKERAPENPILRFLFVV